MTEAKDCILGQTNKLRIDALERTVMENKADWKEDMKEVKDTVKSLNDIVNRIAISVFVSVLTILANVILTFLKVR